MVAIEADAGVGLEQLLVALQARRVQARPRAAELGELKASIDAELAAVGPQGAIVGALRDAIPSEGVLATGTTTVGYMCHLAYPVHQPRTYITSSYMGTLGYCFPTALGAKVARPDLPVVSINGDGGFLFCASELATAVQYGINVVTVVFNDSAYGNTNRDQVENFGGRVIGTELVNPDFVALRRVVRRGGHPGHHARCPAQCRRGGPGRRPPRRHRDADRPPAVAVLTEGDQMAHLVQRGRTR